MRERAGHYQQGHWDWATNHMCCFSLALLSEVAMFALFQCFSIFQQITLGVNGQFDPEEGLDLLASWD
jgi:hypothetical protein